MKPPLVPARDEAGGLEDGEVLRDGAEADLREGPMDVPGRTLAIPDEVEDLAAAGGGQGFQDGAHCD